MPKITHWPAGSKAMDSPQPALTEKVAKIDASTRPHPKFAGMQNTFRLKIAPWDIHRLITEANKLGLQGKEIAGSAYDHDAETILFTVRK